MSDFQITFERTRGHLHDPHVRDLAWLLDSPNLLDPDAAQWQGKIASLFNHQGEGIDRWLIELDNAPEDLHALIQSHAFARLGRYSELLMAFFFRYQQILFAHGLQVRAGKNETVGEFDFLLLGKEKPSSPHLLHWEFATKFYLMESSGADRDADFLVGPNLADTLGAKMRKILDRQLILSGHPAAQVHLPLPVASAQALVKGWLFYQLMENGTIDVPITGASATHCRGYWCALSQVRTLPGVHYRILPRLSWRAPARAPVKACVDKAELMALLEAHFKVDTLPVMVATMAQQDDAAVEVERGFIVPNDWHRRASAFVQGA